jgi:hypothetical protein
MASIAGKDVASQRLRDSCMAQAFAWKDTGDWEAVCTHLMDDLGAWVGRINELNIFQREYFTCSEVR